MSDLDLIRELEDLLGHRLKEIPEARFEKNNQVMASRDWGGSRSYQTRLLFHDE